MPAHGAVERDAENFQKTQKLANDTNMVGNMFTWNALNAPDAVFNQKAKMYIRLNADVRTTGTGIRLLRDECVKRGFAMPAW